MMATGFRLNDIESDIQAAESYNGHAKGFPRRGLKGNYVLVRINIGKGIVVGSYTENEVDGHEVYSWETGLRKSGEVEENM